eukprot:CAMPEP_0168321386 /NCGR_PEP_ID=MMETSP0213-20121227/2245_1 /TAXON_ID=151035 /ORGANISM="Euplotes harpa, Strain FSP1.4" /LENGTH=72 /DNA_ID=CAMNT_0008323037 /DNA_START=67 /DNA_END=282 /DNA_ORIENTATION=-
MMKDNKIHYYNKPKIHDFKPIIAKCDSRSGAQKDFINTNETHRGPSQFAEEKAGNSESQSRLLLSKINISGP